MMRLVHGREAEQETVVPAQRGFGLPLCVLIGRKRGAHYTRPATGRHAPVTALASSDNRKAITAASLPAASQRDVSASGIAARFAGVSMMLGSTALTVTFRSFSSSASASVSRATPAFDAAYAPMPTPAFKAANAPTFTMRALVSRSR